jgi:SAM-dependent methyltransferase
MDFFMSERKRDKQLGIRTTGIREWESLLDRIHYNRYEATPYRALDVLSDKYMFCRVKRIVDFGCGRGRVLFYLHNRFHIPAVGVEANTETYEEAVENAAMYKLKAKHIAAPVEFVHCRAQEYRIEGRDNCFYFFNPFSGHIFREVIDNILQSVEEEKRAVDLILFYPINEYIDYLETATPFHIIDEIIVPGASDKNDKFYIYRLEG